MPGFSTALAPARKRRGEGHTRRDEILQAAKELFLSEGYGATTIRKIADRVGVSAPALYLYFSDKEAILIALCDQTFGFLIERIGDLGKQGLEPREQLRRFGEAYVRFGLEHPQEYWLIFMSGITPKKIAEQGGHRARNLQPGQPGSTGAVAFQHVVKLLREVEASGVRLSYPHETAAELLWMALHGLVAALVNNPDFPWTNRDVLIQGMLDIGLKGVLAD